MTTINNGGAKQKLTPPLPLKPEPVTEEDELRLTKFKLRTEPTNVDSPTYSFAMLKNDGSGTLRQAIQFVRNVIKVTTGLNITVATNKLTMIKGLLTGQALVQFNKGYDDALEAAHTALRNVVRDAGLANNDPAATIAAAMTAVPAPAVHDDFIRAGTQAFVTYVAPHKALAKQKRWMRRFCCKPADMTT